MPLLRHHPSGALLVRWFRCCEGTTMSPSGITALRSPRIAACKLAGVESAFEHLKVNYRRTVAAFHLGNY
jgi:hypothetical protein